MAGSSIGWRARLHYAFDNSMSRGPIALIGWLAVVSCVVILLVSLLVWAGGFAPPRDDGSSPTFVETAWMALMRTMDAGTMGGDAGGWPFLLSMFAVTLGGVFLISLLIGVLTSGIEAKLDELRKGRSRVLESGHTVILGWTPQVFTIVEELIVANANQPRSCIAILSEADKVEMEDRLRERVGKTGRTRVVCRHGSPIDMADLAIVNIAEARAVIVLAAEDGTPDPGVIKTLLAISGASRGQDDRPHVVAEVHDPRNMGVARLAGGARTELVLSGDLVSRVIVQTCRQPGLSVIYVELLDFGGDEVYFQEEPRLVGRSFGEALAAYEDSAIIGLRTQDGSVLLNPPMERRIEAGDRVIAISEDDDTVRLSGRTTVDVDESALVAPGALTTAAPERTLILGWSWRVASMINQLDQYVPQGSSVTVAADDEAAESELPRRCADVSNVQVRIVRCDTVDRGALEALDIAGFDHVILLCDERLAEDQADSRALMTLLHLRDIRERSGRAFTIVSEMRDERNRQLAQAHRADDFVVGDRLKALLLTQIAENRELAALFADLFDPAGSEVYLKPAREYVLPGRPVSFYTVVEAARRRGQAAIGYRRAALAGEARQAYGVVVNPKKSERLAFSEDDRIVVIAEQ